MGRLPVTIKDISLDGVGFEATAALQVGMVVRLGADRPDGLAPVECVVIYQQFVQNTMGGGTYRHGARFIDFNARRIQEMADRAS